MVGQFEHGAMRDAWYPLGSPVDIRRHDVRRTRLLGREIELQVYRTWISPSVDGTALPVTERLGLIWTTLGRPIRPPQQLIEYYEVDRTTLNVSSAPFKRTGMELIEDAVRFLGNPVQEPHEAGWNRGSELGVEVDDDGALRLRAEQADLGALGFNIACEARIADPLSVVFAFRHPSRGSLQNHRYDLYGIFCQPLDDAVTVAHKIVAIIDLPPRELQAIQNGRPIASGNDLVDIDGADAPTTAHLAEASAGRNVSHAYREWLYAQTMPPGKSVAIPA